MSLAYLLTSILCLGMAGFLILSFAYGVYAKYRQRKWLRMAEADLIEIQPEVSDSELLSSVPKSLHSQIPGYVKRVFAKALDIIEDEFEDEQFYQMIADKQPVKKSPRKRRRKSATT